MMGLNHLRWMEDRAGCHCYRDVEAGELWKRRLRREAPPRAGAVRNHAGSSWSYTHRVVRSMAAARTTLRLCPVYGVELQLSQLMHPCIPWTLRRGHHSWFAGRHLSWSRTWGSRSGSYCSMDGREKITENAEKAQQGSGALESPCMAISKSLNPGWAPLSLLSTKGRVRGTAL